MEQKQRTDQDLDRDYTDKEKEYAQKLLELVTLFVHEPKGHLLKSEGKLGQLIGFEHHSELSNFKRLCVAIVDGSATNVKNDLKSNNIPENSFKKFPKYIERLNILGEIPTSVENQTEHQINRLEDELKKASHSVEGQIEHQINRLEGELKKASYSVEGQIELQSNRIEDEQRKALQEFSRRQRKMFFVLLTLTLIGFIGLGLVFFLLKNREAISGDRPMQGSSSLSVKPPSPEGQTMAFGKFGKYKQPVNTECSQVEENFKSAFENFDRLITLKGKSTGSIDKDIQTLLSLTEQAENEKCDQHFADSYLRDKIFRSLFLAYYITKRDKEFLEVYGDYRSQNFPRNEATQKEMEALYWYKRLDNTKQPIDTQLVAIGHVLENISPVMEEDLGKLKGIDIRKSLLNKRSALEKDREKVRQEEERAAKAKIREGVKIWVFDHTGNKISPSDIVAVLKSKGFVSAEYKGTTRQGINPGAGYFAPRMNDSSRRYLLDEIKKTTATGKYLIYESMYQVYSGTKYSLIKDELSKHFVAGEVDVVLVL